MVDLLSWATLHLSSDLGSAASDPIIIEMLHSLFRSTVSLQDLQKASEQEPVLSQFCTLRCPPKSVMQVELVPFHWVKEELSCWGEVCVAGGLGHPRQPANTGSGHGPQGPSWHCESVKQRCRDCVW